MVTLAEVDKLKVNELKAACKELGLEQSGNKADLVARLKEALSKQAEAGGEAAAPTEGGEAAPAKATAEAPAADAEAAANPASTAAQPATDAQPPVPAGEKRRSKIEFSEAEAAKFEAMKVQVVNTAPAPAADKPKVLTDAEKLRARAERFKDPDTERLKQRAQRFNLIDPELEKEKQLKRAERFGTEHPELEKIKKEQRAARFGIVDEETKKKQRLEKCKPLPSADKPKFNVAVKSDEDFEAKRQARAARFAAAS